MAGVVLHSAASITRLLRRFFVAERVAARGGFLQSLRPREKLLGVGLLLVAAVGSRDPVALAALATLPVGLALASGVGVGRLLARSAAVPALSLVVVAPRLVLEPGPALAAVPGAAAVGLPGLAVTAPGAAYLLAFTLRVWTGVALLGLVTLTTPFSSVLAALRGLGVPVALVWTVGLTYRYLFLLLTELRRFLLGRRSRAVGDRGLRAAWRDTGRLAGTFLLRTVERGERVHRGMRARGGGRPPSPYPATGRAGAAEWTFLLGAGAAVLAAAVVRWGA